jgi:hypothetical protein
VAADRISHNTSDEASKAGMIAEYFRRSVDRQPDTELFCERGFLEDHYYRAGQAQRQTLYSRDADYGAGRF